MQSLTRMFRRVLSTWQQHNKLNNKNSTTHISSSWGNSVSCASCCCWGESDHDVSDNYTRHTVTRSSLVCLITRLSVVRGSWLSAPDWPSGEVPVTSRVGGAERPPTPPSSPSPTPSLIVLSRLRTPELHLVALFSHRNQGKSRHVAIYDVLIVYFKTLKWISPFLTFFFIETNRTRGPSVIMAILIYCVHTDNI